ncbi:MAG: hydroxypyruvate isomerase [Candidatus Competibacteraceae bacterium]|nr:hydroxypyruvate isomerase [Candidatus Competibacteraceae bacterium]
MPKFAANLSLLFTEYDFMERLNAAARAGFKGVEYMFPYPFPAGELAERLECNDLTQVLFNLPAGDWDRGSRGIACQPERVQEFRDGVGRALEYARVLNCRQINCLAGIAPQDADPELLRDTLVENLRFAAGQCREAGIRLMLEAINTRDIPGFYLHGSAQTLAIIDQVEADNLFLQYDIYHMQRMEGELAATIQANLNRIGHIQVADNPGRHEPGSGEIHYPFLFDFLDRVGYDGWIGAEYKPATTTEEGLGWVRPYQTRRAGSG